MKRGDKLYVIVRADLPPGLQIAQAIHAQREFAERHGSIEKEWYSVSNTIAVLDVRNEKCLEEILSKADVVGARSASFHEEDLNGSLTAIVLEPGEASAYLCRGLRPALPTGPE